MPNQALLAQLEKLSAVEKLEVIQFLADSLQVHMRDASAGRTHGSQQGRAQPPPPPPSSSSLASAPSAPPPPPPSSASQPAGRLELAAAPGQPALGRMSAESTMQLSVSDLIETEEDAEFVAALTSAFVDDVAAEQGTADKPSEDVEQADAAPEATASNEASEAPKAADASDDAAASSVASAADVRPAQPPSHEAAPPSGQQNAAGADATDAAAAQSAGSGGSLEGVGLTADALARQVDDAMAAALDGPLVPNVAALASEPDAAEEAASSVEAVASVEASAATAEVSQVSIAPQASSTASEHELPVLDDVSEAAASVAVESVEPGDDVASSEAAPAKPSAQEEPEEAFVNEDSVFESLILELADDELRLMETLSAVRRHFWSPLQAGFKALDTEDLKTTIQTMKFAPLRIAIGELVNSSIIALVQKYHDFLSQHLEAQGIEPAAHRDLFVTKKNQAQLVLALRTPFRDYIARLEQLDQGRDALLDALQQVSEDAIAATSPVLSSSRKQILEQYEEARGIEGAWRTLLDVIRFAELPPEAEGALEAFSSGLDAFLEQLGTIYRDVLERVLELWGAHLMAPAKSVLPGL